MKNEQELNRALQEWSRVEHAYTLAMYGSEQVIISAVNSIGGIGAAQLACLAYIRANATHDNPFTPKRQRELHLMVDELTKVHQWAQAGLLEEPTLADLR